MTRLLALLALVLLPATAAAETVQVRSGEHQDFSRLLIDFPDGLGWTFGRVPGGFEFRPDRPDIRYDLSRVDSLISRRRIATLEDRGGGRLFLAVTCACHGDAFDLKKGQVVLDMKDGPPQFADSPFEASLPPPSGPAAALPVGPGSTGMPASAPPTPPPAMLPAAPPGHAARLPADGPLRRAESQAESAPTAA